MLFKNGSYKANCADKVHYAIATFCLRTFSTSLNKMVGVRDTWRYKSLLPEKLLGAALVLELSQV